MTVMPIGFASPFASAAVPAMPPMGGPQAPNESFASMMTKGLENVQGMQSNADGLAVQAATGDLKDIHNYTIAATQAELATELTVAVRNKALEAFGEIMRMSV